MKLAPVEAEPLRQQEALADADHVDGEHHVVADLHRLAGARPAGVEDVLAHRRQDRLAAREGIGGAAHHECQRGILRTGGAARDRGIEHGEACGSGRCGDGADAVHVDGGAIDQQRLGVLGVPHRRDQPALVQPDLAHILARRQHGDDDIGAFRGLGGTAGTLDASSRQGPERGGIEVVAGDAMARLDQVRGHGRTHVAEANETDARHVAAPRGF